jgi:hypothetical protein
MHVAAKETGDGDVTLTSDAQRRGFTVRTTCVQ